MKLDPKHFNTFLAIMAAIAATLIALFTFHNRSSERSDFQKRMFAQDSLKKVYWRKVQTNDSLQIRDFKNNVVVVDFWSNWSGNVAETHSKLASVQKDYPNRLDVISAPVGLKEDEATSYIKKHSFPFHYVAGSTQFSDFNIPGLPAQLFYNQQGVLESIFLGYKNDGRYDSLKTMLQGEND